MKLCAVGFAVSSQLGLGPDDVGYACMPLFHSNSIFVGLMPAFWVGGGLAINERFSASKFLPDVLRHGVTFWNYVGEPVHYVLAAIEKQYGGDEARILDEVAHNPRNHLRWAVGNGAAPPTSTASYVGSGSKTCSSSMARPRPRSAPSAAKATRVAASARCPIRR